MKNIILLLVIVAATVAMAAPFKHMGNPLVMGSKGVPDDSALVELKSTTQGLLPSRMTEAERDLIAAPATGLQLFNTTAGYMQVYDGATWISLGVAGGGFTQGSVMFVGPTGTLEEDNTNFFWDDTNNILQVGAGTPNTSSILETFSTTKGTRPCPSMTEVQRDAIAAPAGGLCVFNSDTDKLNIYNSTVAAWESAGGGLDKWVTAFSYKIDDVIWEPSSDKIYRCTTGHTSNVFATDIANWTELSDDLNKEASATDNALVRWDGTGGDDVQDSLVTVNDTGEMSGVLNLNLDNNLVFVDTSGQISRNTADGSDDQMLAISGGGDTGPTRSGSIRLSGNESIFTGDILLALGDNAAAEFQVSYGAALTIGGLMDSNGKWTLGASGGTEVHQINGDLAISGMTTNSVPYIGASGLLTEDNTGFSYNGSTLTLSGTGASTMLDITQAGSGTSLNINNSGTGDFLVVDTSKLVLDNAGDFGLGVAAPDDTLDVVGTAQIDNIGIDGNTISSRDTNGNVIISPNGTGDTAITSPLQSNHETTPANPAASSVKEYVKSDGDKYLLASSGREEFFEKGLRRNYKQFNPYANAANGLTTDFSTGQNATFDGGGTATATPTIITGALDTTDTKYYQYTMGALNDYFYMQVPVDNGRFIGYNFRYSYDGADDDIDLEVKCSTSGDILTDNHPSPVKASSLGTMADSLFIPTGCGDLKIGFSVATFNSGKILKFNRFNVTDNPFVSANINNTTDWIDSGAITFNAVSVAPTKGTVVRDSMKWRRVGDSMEIQFEYEQSTAGAAGTGNYLIQIPSGYTIDTSKISVHTTGLQSVVGHGLVANTTDGVSPNARVGKIGIYDSTHFVISAYDSTDGTPLASSTNFSLGTATVIYSGKLTVPITGWSANSEYIITPQKGDDSMIRVQSGNGHGSTNTKIRRFSTILDQVGSDITYADSATLGGSFTINKSGTYNITYEDLSTTATEAIGISKNSTQLTTSIAGITAADRLNFFDTSAANYKGISSWSGYLETGDVIRAHTAGQANGTTTTQFTIARVGYKSLSANPVPLTAVLLDVKTSGTAGGTFTSSIWTDRTVNTTEGDTEIVTLTNGTTGTDGTANRFIIGPGTYELEATAPARNVDNHKLRLYDHTAGAAIGKVGGNTVALNGSPQHANSATIYKKFTVNVTTTLSVQHRCQTTSATTGLGLATNFDDEVYTQVKLTKVK